LPLFYSEQMARPRQALCMTSIRLPGLIDPHVHLREPGGTHKEDWDSGTSAALAGGYACVLAMPNTSPPITDGETLNRCLAAAHRKARCDYGVHLGAGAGNVETAASLSAQVVGLKMYLDQTFGPLRLDDLASLDAHTARWPSDRPLLCHAEGRTIAAAILVAWLNRRPVHICHVSRAAEIHLIRAAKERGIPVTCEVTPHHLFLTQDDADAIGPGRSQVRPALATTADRDALWDALRAGLIDCIATDHAPHTPAEKDSQNPPPGFPGLETALPLMLGAVRKNWLELDDLVALMHTNPARIFRLPPQPETWIEVDTEAAWTVSGAEMRSRCGWTPFEGWRLTGRVQRVTLRDRLAYEDGKVLAPAGSGRNVNQSLNY